MRVLFVDLVHHVLNDDLINLGWECVHAENDSIEQNLKDLPHFDGLVIRSKFPVTEQVLRSCPQLKFIARSGAGMENIDVSFAESLGIELFNSPEGNRNAVGEHAVGMLLALMNNLRTAHEEIQNGKWLRFENTGEELEGKTVGIIGFGNNGSAFAKKLLGFDVTVLAYDKYKTGYGDNFVREATLESILAKADVISFHVPQNIETIHYFNEEFLDQLHKPIYLLNLSRGKVVKTAAVVKGLKTGQIKGAGLDVLEYENSSFENFFQNELPADFEFILHAKNILLSPHVAGWSKESYFKLSKVLSDKIISFYFPEKLL